MPGIFIVAIFDSRQKSKFVDGHQIKHKRAHYKVLRKQLQQVKTPSFRKRLKAIGSRENRWMNDINHCVSKVLVENNPKHTLFVLEDLTGVRNATDKAERNESKVIKVNPRYTSQTCPHCGNIDKSNRDKRNHLFTCRKCGYKSNDDRIGAMNLYRMGINYLCDKVPDTVV